MVDGYFGAYNRYYGRLSSGGIRVRGIAARRHDTPTYIREMQREMLTVMGRAGTVADLRECAEPVRKIYERYHAGLHAADVREFLISRRISRLKYAHRCLEASAVQAYQHQGIEIAPGMKISYVVRDAKRYVVDTEWDASIIDAGFYRTLLDRAWEEMGYVFGDPAGGPR
jgi:DNA polymerase I